MFKFPKKNFASHKGFTLIEVIIYVSILALLLSSVTYGVTMLLKTYKNVKEVRRVENSSISAMDRMVREIRNATSINVGSSSLNNTNGVLALDTTDIDGDAATVRFYLRNSRVYVEENGVELGPLTQAQTRASSLTFSSIATSTAASVKIELTIMGSTSTPNLSKNFYSTTVLRGSYQ